MASEKLRSSQVSKELIDHSYKEESDFRSTSRLKDGKFVIGRMLYLCKRVKGQKQKSLSEASKIVASELSNDWINKNVYPITQSNIAKKILDDYKKFKALCKHAGDKKRCKTDDWVQRVKQFNQEMTKNAYDIRTRDRAFQKKLEAENGVKMTDEDEAFYTDNCKGSYKATCSSNVSTSWTKKRKREQSRNESAKKKRAQMKESEKEETCAKKLQFQEALEQTSDTGSIDNDSDFEAPSATVPPPLSAHTRSNPLIFDSHTEPEQTKFPKMKVRSSRFKINEKIVRCTVQCLADYKVSTNDLAGIIVNTANIIFDQNWEKEDESRCAKEEEDSSESEDDEPQYDESSSTSKRRKSKKDMAYVFPSRRTIHRYLEDASYLNLHMVAEQLLDKEDNVVTVGLDDTTKAAGHRMYDLKTDHITIDGPTIQRKTMTTGYVENISHSGKDGAAAYEFKLRCLAILANSSVDEMKSQIDFWMSDRAADCGTLLEELGIDSSQIIKCCAHIILGVDHACDKVFRDIEQKIGVQKLLKVSAGEKVFASPNTSVHTLAQIALAKLLSPSHAAHSISLYNEYTSWMEFQGKDHSGFKGFVANRFGRIAEIAQEYLAQRQSILDFFDAVVDVNSNKLVLAVATYIQNDWFLCCSEVYQMLGDIIIFPLMRLLGIDKKEGSSFERNWNGVRMFFRAKIPELEQIMDTNSTAATGKERLYAAVLDEVITALRRQLSEMSSFFEEGENSVIDQSKLQYAPLTNLGCESEFAKLDNRLGISGGSTSIQTLSRKNVVLTNRLLDDQSFTTKSEEEKRSRWKWARTSEEVANVKKEEEKFISIVKNANRLAVMKKEELKRKKTQKTLKLLDACKEHSGPVTLSTIEMLDRLDEKQLLSEVGYLRATIAPDIRQMRRVKSDGGKFKMEKFSADELRTSIRNAVKPEDNITSDVNSLLLNVIRC